MINIQTHYPLREKADESTEQMSKTAATTYGKVSMHPTKLESKKTSGEFQIHQFHQT